MTGKGFRLVRLAGIDIFLDWSLAIIFVLITISLAGNAFPVWHPSWTPAVTWGTAIAAAVLFLASVLVHELSHALVGRAFGIDIPRITLFVFGGMAQLREEPHGWKQELWMALAGPVTSLVLGFVFIGLGLLSAGSVTLAGPRGPEAALAALSPLSTLLFWLGPINVVLAVFNMLPGFPLDGGRVLRAILWGLTRSLRRATRWASYCAQLIAWLLIAAGISMALGVRLPWLGTGVVSGVWLALIGWFLYSAAITSYRQVLIRESLADVPVSKLMKAGVESVEPVISVHRFVDEHVLRGEQRAFPVVDCGEIVGLISLRDVHNLPRADWDTTSVGAIMTPASRLAAVRPADSGYAALVKLNERGINQLPVVDSGRVLGLLRREDVLRWLSVYGERVFRDAGA